MTILCIVKLVEFAYFLLFDGMDYYEEKKKHFYICTKLFTFFKCLIMTVSFGPSIFFNIVQFSS